MDDHETAACGHDPDLLVDHVWDGSDLPADQRACPRCRAELRRHRRAAGIVADLARVRVRAPNGFTHRVMDRVRGDDLPDLQIHAGPAGTTSVSALVIELAATRCAHEVPGIAGVREIAASEDGIRMAVTVDLHRPVPDTVDDLRVDVARVVGDVVGIDVWRIDVVVRDVRGDPFDDLPGRGDPEGS